jgi:integrase
MRGGRQPKKPLTALFVRTAKVPGKYFDGHGLFLRVMPTGAKQWVQRITIRGKRREIGLGSSMLVSLAEAREHALENRKLARAGGDPLAEKRKAKAILTFEAAARKTHEELSPTWKNPKDRASFLSTMETNIFPRFGSVSVAEVTSADVRQAILEVRKKTPEVARKLKFRIASVFKWAIAEGMREENPATTQALALPRFEKAPSHFKALPYEDVAGCIAVIRSSGAAPSTKLAVEFLILTACRSGEVRGARWDEIYLANHDGGGSATWEIPATRMKMKKAFRVPLPPRAVEVLKEAQKFSDASGLVFPGTKPGRPLSDMTLLKLVKQLGFDASVHGFRTSFRTWAQEKTNFPSEICEAALAHKVGTDVERRYARSDVFDKRRMLMESWANYLTVQRGQIINLKAKQ